MKNLYHLFVTSYKLHVTSYKLRVTSYKLHIARFKRFTSHLLPHTSYLFLFLPFFAFAQTTEKATITNLNFSCPGIVEVTYDLQTCGPVDVTLYYSADKCEPWTEAITVSGTGSTPGQTMGKDKTIVWDAAADKAIFGKFYYKVEYTLPPLPDEPDYVTINGVKWAPVNLDVGGWFCDNPWDYGGFYQWGRMADGHECPYSALYPCNNTSSPSLLANGSSVTPLTSTNLDSNGQPTGTVNVTATNCPALALSVSEKFIKCSISPYDWRSPHDDNLWNSGTAAVPEKTVNDPCPDGWRVPTQTQINSLTVTANVSRSWTTNYSGTGINGFLLKNIPDDGSSLFFPAAGRRSYSTGSLQSVGTIGNYQSSTTSVPLYPLIFNLNFSSPSFFNIGTSERAYGISVRCVVDQ